ESAIVPKEIDGRTVVHAVLVLRSGVIPEKVIESANKQLDPFQQIRSFSVWPVLELPKTSTGKLKRKAIAEGIIAEPSTNKIGNTITRLLSGNASQEKLDEDLGLGSLDRVELLMELESAGGVNLDEAAF